MAKEDTRAELEQDIRSLEEKINDVLSQETIDFSELTKLQDEKERLEKLLTLEEKENDNLEKDDDQKENNQEEQSEREEKEPEKDEQEEIETEKDEQEKSEDNHDEIGQEDKDDKQDVEEEIYDNREPEEESKTPEEWRRESGIRALGLQEGKEYTREEFLGQPGIVYMVELPGKAENFLGKDAKEWDKIKTSVSCLYDAVRDNRFPAKINNAETYILLQYDKDKVMDKDENPDKSGYARIDKNDIDAATTEKEDKAHDDEKDEDNEKEEPQEKKQGICKSIWNKAQAVIGSKELRKILAKIIAKEIVPMIIASSSPAIGVASSLVANLATSIIEANPKEIFEGIPKGDLSKVGKDIQYGVLDPNMGNEEKTNKEEKEFLPGFPPPPMH